MNKKFVLPITFAIILASAVFVLADNFNIKYNVAVDEGWNLLQGFVTPDLITGGEITSQDVVAVYAYLPSENKYARIYPNPEVKVDDEELLNSAFWVYLKKSGWLEYNVEEEWAYANNRNMVAGWNFVGITPDILGKSLNEIMGDCNIEKAYFWNFEDKEWNSLTEGRLKDNKFNNDVIGLGVVVKVSNDCRMGSSGGSSINPPTIPGDENNIDELIINRNIGNLNVNRVLGQEYVEREYSSFPLDKMIRADAIKYGLAVGINAIVFEFNGDNKEILEDIIEVYDTNFDFELLSPPAYSYAYKLTQTENVNNQVAVWYNGNYFVIINGDNIFVDGSDYEEVIEEYLTKYPSTLTP